MPHSHTQTDRRTDTHPANTRTGLFTNCFGFQPQAHIWITWVLCLDRVPRQTHSMLPPSRGVELHPHSSCKSQPFYNPHMTALTARANESQPWNRWKTNLLPHKVKSSTSSPSSQFGKQLHQFSIIINIKQWLFRLPWAFFFFSSSAIHPFLLCSSCFTVKSQVATLSLYSQ